MTKLLEILETILENTPDILTMDDAIYIKGRRIAPDVLAKIAPTDDQHVENGRGWYILEIVEFIQEHDPTTPETELANLQQRGWLRQDQEIVAMLHEVVTAKEIAALFGIKEDTVRDACQRRQIVARKSGTTWLLMLEEAKQRWGKK